MKLELFYGDEKSERILAPENKEIVIGRPGDLPIDLDLSPDVEVSRPHAKVFYDSGGWWVQDLGSKHGTRLNGVVITRLEALAPGDQLQMGKTVLRAEWKRGSVSPADAGGRPIHATTPIKILFLAANPRDTDPLRLSQEVRTIDQCLRSAEFRKRFELRQHWAVRPSDLSECLLRNQPHIVHFSGHGSQSGELVLEDDRGEAKPVTAEAMASLLRVLRDNLRCVVLNACWSAVHARAIVREVDCVVGMARRVGDPAAIAFASGFYRALGYGRDIGTALGLGRAEIELAGLNEQTTPQLLLRDGVDAGRLAFA